MSDEILPGLRHWSAVHPNIGSLVSSYVLIDAGVVLNPIEPEDEEPLDGIEVFDIVLTNRHHVRDSAWAAGEQDASVHVPAAGIDDVDGLELEVVGYRDGDTLPGRLRAIEIGAISPDEFAIHLPAQQAVAVADGVIRHDDGPLTIVPDELLGDDPEGVKRGLGAAFVRLCEEVEFEHLLLAHGLPLLDEGRKRLWEYADQLTHA